MVHQDNPTLTTINKLRGEGTIPCHLKISQSIPHYYTIIDNENVTYGSFSNYVDALAALKALKGK